MKARDSWWRRSFSRSRSLSPAAERSREWTAYTSTLAAITRWETAWNQARICAAMLRTIQSQTALRAELRLARRLTLDLTVVP